MTALRRLAYRWLSPPWLRRRAVARSLGNPFRDPVRVPPPLADLPPGARACWLPLPGEASDPAILAVLDVVSRQPLAAGVLLGRTAVVSEA